MELPESVRKHAFVYIMGGFFSFFGLIGVAAANGWLDRLVPFFLWTFFLVFGLGLVAGLLRPILGLIPSVRRAKWFAYWPELTEVSAGGSEKRSSSASAASGDDKPRFGGGSSGGAGAGGGW